MKIVPETNFMFDTKVRKDILIMGSVINFWWFVENFHILSGHLVCVLDSESPLDHLSELIKIADVKDLCLILQ